MTNNVIRQISHNWYYLSPNDPVGIAMNCGVFWIGDEYPHTTELLAFYYEDGSQPQNPGLLIGNTPIELQEDTEKSVLIQTKNGPLYLHIASRHEAPESEEPQDDDYVD